MEGCILGEGRRMGRRGRRRRRFSRVGFHSARGWFLLLRSCFRNEDSVKAHASERGQLHQVWGNTQGEPRKRRRCRVGYG